MGKSVTYRMRGARSTPSADAKFLEILADGSGTDFDQRALSNKAMTVPEKKVTVLDHRVTSRVCRRSLHTYSCRPPWAASLAWGQRLRVIRLT